MTNQPTDCDAPGSPQDEVVHLQEAVAMLARYGSDTHLHLHRPSDALWLYAQLQSEDGLRIGEATGVPFVEYVQFGVTVTMYRAPLGGGE